MTLRNVPSFLYERERRIGDLASTSRSAATSTRSSPVDDLDPAHAREYIDRGAEIMAAVNEDPPVHPLDERISGCRHVVFHAPGRDGARRPQRHLDPPGLARSLAVRHRARARGWPSCTRAASWRSAQDFVNESLIGTRFTGRLVEETTVGDLPAVVPEITGRAWVTGSGEYLLHADDPFPAGFAL